MVEAKAQKSNIDVHTPVMRKIPSNASVCSSCISETGGCCSRVKFSVTEKEIGPFREAERLGFPEGHLIELNDDDGYIKTYNYISGDDKCVFLGSDNRCQIYDQRPLICRTYPLNWRLKRQELTFFLDFECVLSHLKPINSFFRQANTPEVKLGCKELGDMDFSAKERRYINLNRLYDEANPQFLLDPE